MLIASAVALGLLGWLALAMLLGRRAERAVSADAVPPPWPTLASAAAVIAGALVSRPIGEAALCGCACIALVAASGPDARTGYLFDAVTLPAALLVTVLAAANDASGNAVAGVTLLVGTFGTLVICSRGRLMGLGDVKALYAVGAAFGPLESLVVLFAACTSGVIGALLSGKFARGTEIRFGPHLAAGSAFALVAGRPIVHRIMGL
ncbi:MAG: hypothetical protein NVS3B16_13270 [Vulcanimicrobiaceae bacterium]